MMSASPTEKQNAAPAGTGTADREHCHKKNTTNATPRKAYRAQSEWRKRNPHKYLAHITVQNALRLGVIEKQPCQVCGDPKSEGHHPDYWRPLHLVWLCRKHHKQVHARSDA